MIIHIVFFNIQAAEGYDQPQNIERLKVALEALPTHISEINKLEVGVNFNEAPAAYDLSLYTEFSSKEDLQTYQVHPEHMKVVELVKSMATGRAVVDYER